MYNQALILCDRAFKYCVGIKENSLEKIVQPSKYIDAWSATLISILTVAIAGKNILVCTLFFAVLYSG